MKDWPPKSKCPFNFNLDEEDFESFKCGYIPLNTVLDTQKCVKLFSDWASTRNAHFPGNPVLDNILSSTDKTQVCAWICKFASEAQKKDGEPYPPKTIHHYIMGIWRHIKQATKSSVNLPRSAPTTVWGRTGWQDSFSWTFLTNVSWKEVDTAPLKGWENTSGQMFFKNYKFVKHWTVLQQENACATKLLLHSRLLLLSPYQGSAAVRLTIVCSVCFTTSHIPSDRCNSPYRVNLTGIDLAELFDWLLLFLETQHCVCIVFASSFIVFIASYIWRVAW